MDTNEHIEIALSKKKMIFSFTGTLIFVAMGVWFVIKPPTSELFIFRNPTVIVILGIVAILFFGLLAIVLVKKLLDNKPGLVINSRGIIDNSSGISVGFIPWTDIQDIQTTQVSGVNFLIVILRNPHDYLDKVTQPLRKFMMKQNYRSYNSLVSISSSSLDISFVNLQNLMVDKFRKYKKLGV